MDKKPQLIIYDAQTDTTSVREYDSHSKCFAEYTTLKSLGLDVKVVVA